ncbi:MAG: tyrosine-type recombinase/integrase, partial [Vicinamibacteria bacterium]
ESLKFRHTSSSSIKAVSTLLNYSYWTGSKDVREIGEADVALMMKHLAERPACRTGKPLKRTTREGIMATWRRLFGFLERERWILVSPMKDVKLKRRKFLPKSISQEKVAALLDARPSRTPLEQRDRAILELLYGTGLRVSEASALDLTDINLKEATLLVRNGKGRKDRYVPIPLRAREALQMYLTDGREILSSRQSSGALFLSVIGGRLEVDAVRGAVIRAAHAAKIQVSPHILRHSFATHLLEGGASILHVQKLLGHSRLTTTAIYTKVQGSTLRKMVETSHPRERPRRRRQPA